jgi:hypothetical protein
VFGEPTLIRGDVNLTASRPAFCPLLPRGRHSVVDTFRRCGAIACRDGPNQDPLRGPYGRRRSLAMIAQEVSALTMGTEWSYVELTLEPEQPGLSTLALDQRRRLPEGVCFYADDASITRTERPRESEPGSRLGPHRCHASSGRPG